MESDPSKAAYDKRILITGGAGFIGSNFLNYVVPLYPRYQFINADSLTPAANLKNITCSHLPNYVFEKVDIRELKEIKDVFEKHAPNFVINFAAESHVDISMRIPFLFVSTNIVGTHNLLSLSRDSAVLRFVQISTDEVYGSLGKLDAPFTETSPLNPNNPYSATKAAADCLVRAYNHTWGLDTIITRSSNNYGARQYPNKLIPKFIRQLLSSKPVTVHGSGEHVRDWLYVEDNVRAIDAIFHKGKGGEVYNIGGQSERSNIEVARALISLAGKDEDSFLKHVTDRPGNDERYALDISKIKKDIGWAPTTKFEEGLEKTFRHYANLSGSSTRK